MRKYDEKRTEKGGSGKERRGGVRDSMKRTDIIYYCTFKRVIGEIEIKTKIEMEMEMEVDLSRKKLIN